MFVLPSDQVHAGTALGPAAVGRAARVLPPKLVLQLVPVHLRRGIWIPGDRERELDLRGRLRPGPLGRLDRTGGEV